MIGLVKMKEILAAVSDDLISRERELCALDGYIGDGDHGTTIRHAFEKIKAYVSDTSPEDMGSLFMGCAEELSEVTGGAIGPVLSAFFMGLSFGAGPVQRCDTERLAGMFRQGLQMVMEIGGARKGDKTLVDALYPAVEAIEAFKNETPKKAMLCAAESAREGAEATKNLAAVKGRARTLGDRSIGYVDAGAMTMYYFIQAFADAL